ncbi:immunoglobulin superfamily member 1-like [Mauremys mutica]|uniref:immunoglobulin superfamily member 1-like n=1 Tax=Mauremys mutica TaxID=74926 RepID=UPI001D16C7FD|nr:immunoglobulin superfamily member 1-like [Mauremys mutica]
MEFVLHKAGHPNPQVRTVPHGTVAEFPIPSVSREDGGSYTCDYRSITEPSRWSYPSDPVEIIVAEPSYPKPSISLSPSWGVSLGGDVTVQCWGQHQSVWFVLNKEGRNFSPVDSDGLEAEFPISNVHRDLGGSYSCSYHSRSQPFNVSYPSDPVELVVRDPSLPRPAISLSPTGPFVSSEPSDPVQLVVAEREFLKPTIWVSPSRVVALGGNVTIRCEGQDPGMEFVLRKVGHPNMQVQTVPDGPLAEFPIPSVSREDGGSYTCDYRSITEPSRWSYLSDPVEIIVAEPSYPKPNITLQSRSWGVSLGGAVTIWCRGQRQGVRFVLNKERRRFPPVDSVGLEAEFPISNVSREDGGSYSCSYHSRSEPFAVSYPSDPVELVVRDPGLPRPSISLSPTGVTAPGADVTIRCEGQRRDVRFLLHKAGDLNPQRHMDPAGAGAEFRIPSVSRQHGGSYSCSYRPRSEPFISSEASDPVQLVVAEREFLKPTIWVSPSRVVALGGNITIRCEGQDPGMEFVLRKVGHPNMQMQTVPHGPEAEFPIPSVSREDGGSYTCDYRSITEPSRWSYPSDAVEIIVAEPSYPKPNITLKSRSWGVSLGGAVAIWCRGQRQGVRFVLNKERRRFPPVDSVGLDAEFPISNVSWEHSGSYSCFYHSKSEPFAVSYPSDPVELVEPGVAI